MDQTERFAKKHVGVFVILVFLMNFNVKTLFFSPRRSRNCKKKRITSKETFDLTENADDDIEDDDRINDSKQNTEMITFTRSNRDERKFVEQQRFPTPPPPPPEAMTVIPKSLSQTFQQQTILSEYCEPN
ncbi:hypothetical protein NH340_JMT00299 [Sarcoptes scabiei]|uniref:Uncharacterized protein n=1 Tax=Sarcoptes scabiei TaxID=52283 RepID=A0A132A5K6_SARSC|nr:hypothetical protein QR98_0041790 [Sarcoptes scabiei]UXI14356.1 hypothetical protein NH340_JMT00299 [Sarcoptes scabiei]